VLVNPHYRAVGHLHLAAMSLDHAMDELLLAASAAVAAQRGRVMEMFLACLCRDRSSGASMPMSRMARVPGDRQV
jgi:hypothetical protein